MHSFLCMTVISQNIVRDADDEPREIPVASLMVFRTQYLVERLTHALIFIEQFSEPHLVLFDSGTVFFVAQDIEWQEEEQSLLKNLVERKRLHLDERDMIGNLSPVWQIDDDRERVRRLLGAPQVEHRCEREADARRHDVRRMLPMCVLKRDGRAVLKHAQRHLTVRRTLAFDMIRIPCDVQDGIGDEFLLNLKVFVAQLRFLDILGIVRMEHFVDERNHKLRHFLHHRAVDVIKNGRPLSGRGSFPRSPRAFHALRISHPHRLLCLHYIIERAALPLRKKQSRPQNRSFSSPCAHACARRNASKSARCIGRP